jgi:hypothetical protein
LGSRHIASHLHATVLPFCLVRDQRGGQAETECLTTQERP